MPVYIRKMPVYIRKAAVYQNPEGTRPKSRSRQTILPWVPKLFTQTTNRNS